MGSLQFELIGGVAKSVDATDLKSVEETHTGSSPVSATKFEKIEGIPWPHKCKFKFTEETLPSPVWDTTKDEKDYCHCGGISDTLYQGHGFCDYHWYRWLCDDRGYDVSEPDEDSRFVATVFI